MTKDEDAAGGDDDEQPLDLTPLLSLSPMFPTPPGYDLVATQPPDPPFVYVTPRCSSERPTPAPAPAPAPASLAVTAPVSAVPLNVTPISMVFPAPATPSHNDDDDDSSDQDYTPFREKRTPAAAAAAAKRRTAATRRTRRGGDGDSMAASIERRKKIRRSIDNELLLAAGCPSSSYTNPRESVGTAMSMFDSLRRRMLQMDENEGPGAGKRADLEASALMMKSNLRVNTLKTIGPVPGIEIGDIFFYRMEMCVVGLHAPSMAGIDYISGKHVGEEDETLAMSIISSGGYENNDDDTDTLVYTGHGGNSRYKKHDQKLERGNLALMNSSNKKNQIRVVRGAPDPFCKLGKIYVYDGIYRVEDSWMDTANNGFNVFKYRLRREPGQPDGISVWKMTAKWRANRSTRENVILPDLSSKVEKLPVCLVSDVDNEKRPPRFYYVTGVKYSGSLSRNEPLQCCKCSSVCLPGDSNCSCAQRNGSDLPYSASGVLVKHVPMLYECSTNCHCSQDCRNRVTQKGVRLNFEVFWTGDRGWGLRSWDPIRAGAFICEYAGEVIDETKTNTKEDDDDYTFQTSCPNDKVLKWNMGAELLEGESSDSTTSQSFKQLPIIIRAKDAGNVARFLNHSCSPNLLWQAVQYDDHGDDDHPHIAFFAMQHIPPMTELTYDYGVRGATPGIKGKFPGDCKLKPCLCGSTNCRGSF